jgi:hypothetical protein
VRGFRSTFRRFRAGAMSSSAFSRDGGGVGGRQVAGRIGELGGELSGELGMELRGEERSEAASKYMSLWGRPGASCGSSGGCIGEPDIVFQAVTLSLTKCKVELGEIYHLMIPSTQKVCERPLSPAQNMNEKQ